MPKQIILQQVLPQENQMTKKTKILKEPRYHQKLKTNNLCKNLNCVKIKRV